MLSDLYTKQVNTALPLLQSSRSLVNIKTYVITRLPTRIRKRNIHRF